MISGLKKHGNIGQVISNINAAVTNIRLYTAKHPQAERYLEDAYIELSKYLLDSGDTVFDIKLLNVFHGCIIF